MWRLRAAPRAGPCPRVQLLRPRQPEGPASAAAQHHGGAQADLSIVRTSRPRSPDCVTVHIAGRGVDPRDVTLERLTDLNDYVTGLRRRAAGADLAAKDRNRYRAPRRRLPAPTNAQVNGSTLTATSERDSDFVFHPLCPSAANCSTRAAISAVCRGRPLTVMCSWRACGPPPTRRLPLCSPRTPHVGRGVAQQRHDPLGVPVGGSSVVDFDR